jgi:hypothetical protein
MRRSNSRNSSASGAQNITAGNGSSSINWSGSAVIQVAQRSNGASVKVVIAAIKKDCETAQQQHQDEQETGHVPLEECGMLSLWAVDAYYQVLISKYGGIDAIVTAMRVFPNSAELQAYGCQTLKNMSNTLASQKAGGVTALADAMGLHPQSIHVQSEACEALQSQSTILAQEPIEVLQSLLPLLEHAKDMYLTPKGRTSARFTTDLVRDILFVNAGTGQAGLEHDAILQT